jgi:hypothetical protein
MVHFGSEQSTLLLKFSPLGHIEGKAHHGLGQSVRPTQDRTSARYPAK